jgi:hypothetical protein
MKRRVPRECEQDSKHCEVGSVMVGTETEHKAVLLVFLSEDETQSFCM